MRLGINTRITNTREQLSTFSRGKTLYVGGSGEGNYSKIQEAINDASDGDTVFVYNGTYYENILVNKSIKLTGESRNITIIDGGGFGDVVHLSANQVNISGFTIRNSGVRKEGYWDNDAGIDAHSHNNIITGNNISNNRRDGIFIMNGYKYNLIKGNIISSNGYHGIQNEIDLFDTIIQGNIISKNQKDGIQLYDVANTLIIENIITNNLVSGIYLMHGKNNTIRRNIITDNVDCGIFLENIYESAKFESCKVIGNNISNNDCGIYTLFSYHHTISKNNIINNYAWDATFDIFFDNMIAGPTLWSRNYWNKPRTQPFPILGVVFSRKFLIGVPWFQFDRHPAQEPYDIDDDIISRINTYNR